MVFRKCHLISATYPHRTDDRDSTQRQGESVNYFARAGSCVSAWRFYWLPSWKVWYTKDYSVHNPDRERRVKDWFNKYGAALLLISPWIPFAGDLVPIVAGVESFKLSTFLVIMFIAKAIKGAAIVFFLSFFVQLLNFHP
ncbi:MAG: VTT domain-containing protein [Halobacteriota archaeon]